VHATPGAAGGYRPGAAAALPPLLLDDEEAVAVAIGLGAAADAGIAGIEETSVRALAKLEPAELAPHLTGITQRYQRAAGLISRPDTK
jgi:predicted DNA-binding transcriptional regulator YafY